MDEHTDDTDEIMIVMHACMTGWKDKMTSLITTMKFV